MFKSYVKNCVALTRRKDKDNVLFSTIRKYVIEIPNTIIISLVITYTQFVVNNVKEFILL